MGGPLYRGMGGAIGMNMVNVNRKCIFLVGVSGYLSALTRVCIHWILSQESQKWQKRIFNLWLFQGA